MNFIVFFISVVVFWILLSIRFGETGAFVGMIIGALLAIYGKQVELINEIREMKESKEKK